MKKINEEVSGKKQRRFNVRRFAAVAAGVLVLAGASVYVEAKFDIMKNVSERMSNLYNKSQSGDVILNEKEKEIIKDLSLETTMPSEEITTPSEETTTPSETVVPNDAENKVEEEVYFDMLEVGDEFEVDGGRIRIDGVTYDGALIYFMYTSFADDATPDNPINLIGFEARRQSPGAGFDFMVVGKEKIDRGARTTEEDLDANEEGYQGYYAFRVTPVQRKRIIGEGTTGSVNNFMLSQGDVIIFTDRKYYRDKPFNSLSDVERIYGGITLSKPINDLVFTCENTEGMEVLETVTGIRISPLSITIMGDEFLRKTYPEGIGYVYRESADGRKIVTGATGDKENENTKGGYAVKVVKKDGTVAAFGDMPGEISGDRAGEGYEYFYHIRTFAKPLDLAEVDYILVYGWGLEYKIPVNVTE
ncbi:MAG: hypothetical protein IJW18_00420 [Lachnospiraceae bacterium]|nr:hypothetical protein [Lachnospiraceae bacterium]